MILFLFVIMMVQISDPIGVNHASISPSAITGPAAPVAAAASTSSKGGCLVLWTAPVTAATHPDHRLISLALASTLNESTSLSPLDRDLVAGPSFAGAGNPSFAGVASVATDSSTLSNRTPTLMGWRSGLALGAASGAAAIGVTAPVNGSALYFYPAWSIEFHTLTDLQTFANLLYVGYSVAFLLIGVTLWVTMIGIIKVTTSGGA
ncbi:hypothetical protein DFS34DRAFT_445807 [Phlyctochytrium arcticum]|nr:hypothetical protein DFS34DRAFT_517872 [Phlyctochytrium arcticum]KAI9088705.1 hypothetical protein DFS34DRAFT_445807 [Phlyctochytrium arcticum]